MIYLSKNTETILHGYPSLFYVDRYYRNINFIILNKVSETPPLITKWKSEKQTQPGKNFPKNT